MNTELDGLAVAHICAAAMYASQAFYSFAFWMRQRHSVERLFFAGICAGLCVAASAGAAATMASSEATLALTQRVTHVGLGLTAVAFVEFGARFAVVPAWIRRGAYVGVGVALAILASGHYLAEVRGPAAFVIFDGAGHVGWPTSMLGSVFSIAVVAFVAATLVRLVTGLTGVRDSLERTARERRLVVVATLPMIALMGHDLLLMTGCVRSHYLVPLGALPMAAAVAVLFMQRVVSTADHLSHRTEAIKVAHRELRTTRRRLLRREQLAAVGELSAVIAHEVRNPLAVIKNAVAGLRRASLSEDDEGTLLSILGEETDRLNRLMHDLLAYARPVSPTLRPVELASLLGRVVSRVELDDVSVSMEVPESLYVPADGELLRHALLNVVENAVQSPGAGTLSIRAEVHGESVAIALKDDGEGMAAETLEKALAPFFTTKPAGTGLGLAIVDRIVRSHGGRLTIDSVKGEGTTVTLELPLSVSPESDDESE
ncbi:MAG: ATP-binding protein [Myxococcota bacterium]